MNRIHLNRHPSNVMPTSVNSSRRRAAPSRVVHAGLFAALSICAVASTGCVRFAALWANMTGGDKVDAEFNLTKGPLLILLDDPNEDQISDPRVYEDLHKGISAHFLNFQVNSRVIPFEDWARLKQSDSKYNKLTIREIGEKLGAEQVLYLRVTRFVLQPEPGADVFQGEFSCNVKVLSTEGKRDVRLWPKEDIGKKVTVRTKAEPSDGDRSAADVAADLATRMGQDVSALFYSHRSLEKPRNA